MLVSESLHCGACNTPFNDTEALSNHLRDCGAAKAILIPLMSVATGAVSDPRHLVSHVSRAITLNRELIEEYASAVVTEMNSYERSKIHERLCRRLGVNYSDFRPFESEAIVDMPTKEEAVQIIYKSLGDLMRNELFSKRNG